MPSLVTFMRLEMKRFTRALSGRRYVRLVRAAPLGMGWNVWAACALNPTPKLAIKGQARDRHFILIKTKRLRIKVLGGGHGGRISGGVGCNLALNA